MKFRFLLSLCLAFSAYGVVAQPLEPAVSREIASQFFKSLGISADPEAVVVPTDFPVGSQSATYTIYNAAGPTRGFVIISNDRRVFPILAYSRDSEIDPKNMPINMRKWVEQYDKQIRQAVRQRLAPTVEIAREWASVVEGKNQAAARTAAVAPLVQARWNQSPYYNDLCPYDPYGGGTSVAGCVAIAMAQIMHYWKYPAQGNGFHSYSPLYLGSQSANFGNTTYMWADMPNTVSTTNLSVATLVYHCGVAVDMNYSASSSGAYVIGGAPSSEYALKNYFRYDNSLKGVTRASYTESSWIALLKAELDAGRPILHTGFSTGSGHAFVCDGYDNSSFFHFNWGWGGLADGYYRNNQLNPTATGTGAGLGSYNDGQQAIIGIKPPGGGAPPTPTVSLELKAAVVLTPSTITYKQTFTIDFDILNKGTGSFAGTYGALLFDKNNKFLMELGTNAESTGLAPNAHRAVHLSTSADVAPGAYSVGIYAKAIGETSWTLVKPGSFQSQVPFTVSAGTDIAMYAPMTLTCPVLTVGKPCVIKLDVQTFANPFTGDITLDLHDEEGNWVQEIMGFNNISMCANCHFTNGLSFSTSGINQPAGTYLLVVWMRRTGLDWELVSSSSLGENPVYVVLSDPPLAKDIYEDNNTPETSKLLSLSTLDTIQFTSTNGANSHKGDDYDYYSIQLPMRSGGYFIDARTQDSYSATDGQTYTNDVRWAYRVDNGDWSDIYDDVSDGFLKIPWGGKVTFIVAPYFIGQVGTYKFEMRLWSTDMILGLEEESDKSLSVFPVPAKDQFTVRLNDGVTAQQLMLLDIMGREVWRQIDPPLETRVGTEGLGAGIYFLQVVYPNQTTRRRKVILLGK